MDLYLTLTPSHGIDPPKTPNLSPCSIQHVNPPAGVPSAIIESVDIRLQISRCPTTKNSSSKRKRGFVSRGTRNGVDPESGGSINESPSTGNYCPLNIDLQPRIARMETESASLLRNKTEDTANISAPVSPTFEIRICSQSSASSQSSLIVPAGKSHIAEWLTPRLITFAELTKLVDCSLRGVIFTPKQAMCAGLLLSSVTDDPKLSQISPAIFCPGYLKVVWKASDRRDESKLSLCPGHLAAKASALHPS